MLKVAAKEPAKKNAKPSQAGDTVVKISAATPVKASTVIGGVPMPVSVRGGGANPKYPWPSMKPGDAFFVVNGKVETFYTLTAGARKKYGLNFRAARLDDGSAFGPEYAGQPGVGVWCLPNE